VCEEPPKIYDSFLPLRKNVCATPGNAILAALERGNKKLKIGKRRKFWKHLNKLFRQLSHPEKVTARCLRTPRIRHALRDLVFYCGADACAETRYGCNQHIMCVKGYRCAEYFLFKVIDVCKSRKYIKLISNGPFWYVSRVRFCSVFSRWKAVIFPGFRTFCDWPDVPFQSLQVCRV
jgi:hypothetical protein